MGIFMETRGTLNVPQEKQKEFKKRVLKLFRSGGMFGFEPVRTSDKVIFLLKELEFDENGSFCCDYSIYDNKRCEPAGLNGREIRIYSNKLGWKRFNAVVSSAYLLWEIYSDTYGITGVDWGRHRIPSGIKWLNYLFNEDYTIPNRDDYIKAYRVSECESPDRLLDYLSPISVNYRAAAEYCGLCTAVYGVDKAIEMLREENSNSDTVEFVCKEILTVREFVREIRKGLKHKKGDEIDNICKQLCNFNIDGKELDRYYAAIHLSPKSAVIKVIAEAFGVNFDDIYENVLQKLSYESFSEALAKDSIGTISTESYLNLTKDDMLHCSDNLDGISTGLQNNIKKFRENYTMALKNPKRQSVVDLVHMLYDAHQTFGEVWMFKDTFDEFAEYCNEPQYQAVLQMISYIIEVGQQEVNQYPREEKELIYDREHPRYIYRKKLNELFAVLYNKRHRFEVFGF